MRRAGEIDPHPEIDPLSAAVAARRLRGEGVGHLPCEERLLLEGRRTELKKKMKEYQQTVADLEGFRPSVNSGRKGMGFEKENEGDEAEADVARGIACALALYDEAWRRKDRMTFLRDLAEEEKMRPFTFKPETNVGKPGAPSGASVLPCADETGPDSTTLYLDRLRRVREIRDRRREAELKSREQREMEECTFRPRVRGAPPFVHRIARSLQVARNAAARKQVYQEHPCSDGFSSYRASQPRFPGTVSPEDLSARRVDWK
uniref:Uncharacterized protein n=1 Tax=Chromera velia CCMP2878 TaxID=1169474 RepID=A0A0G4GDK7_9ALVE|eukprot:Cvel_21421.t1-p1 / transcript=Cvel_21421.t1 / gene=Cvel_21421 / organism=Chromera_velia_CCMP2878 / gene_product=hypothetical protein / transcript_product=hypothetical protein / location=Cvel_scaffold2007:30006-33605(-) / protein_length=260 / sequence_SO=supercontig / SO=protein_coding / is_pseudo=false